MNNYPWFISSTGKGVAQRLISLVALIIPILSYLGVNIAQGDVETLINATLIVVFAVWHGWAWIRARYNKQNKLGKYAP